MTKRSGRPRTAIVGTGHLARALAPLLLASGYRIVAVAGRRPASARALARTLRGARAVAAPERAVAAAELILLAVPDREIAPLARRLSAAGRPGLRGKTFLHHAGALGREALEPLATAGAAVGVLHPLQALGEPAVARDVLPGSTGRIEGQGQGLRVARRLARDLGLVALELPPGSGEAERAAYHAAGALASNDVLALVAIALELLESAGVPRARALRALGALARGTLVQAERAGIGAAITGPASRGDVDTLRRHLRELERRSPADAEVHRALSLRLLDLAVRERVPGARAARRKIGDSNLISRAPRK
jgi:predicted short-subunit dehydrogenase-like oxidoreductase (DUF2520 family)